MNAGPLLIRSGAASISPLALKTSPAGKCLTLKRAKLIYLAYQAEWWVLNHRTSKTFARPLAVPRKHLLLYSWWRYLFDRLRDVLARKYAKDERGKGNY